MLELYKNIKRRRLELGMSQEELAQKVGYKNRSSIARIERGDTDLPRSKIFDIAEALGISAGELMGDDGLYINEEGVAQPFSALEPIEDEILSKARRLRPEYQIYASWMLDMLLKMQEDADMEMEERGEKL